MLAAVVLADDAVQRLDVDGVGHTHGRLQFGAAGNAVGHGSHLRVMCRVNWIVVKTGRTPLRLSRDAARPHNPIDCYAMDSNALHTNSLQCIPFNRYGYHCNGYPWSGRRRR